ncbi:MAG: hypothetical protein P1U82_27260, partial [Verrucomicrobiales bacterium]|nr:hypothetical protein [Verrucomicrobiales bacterium]
ADTGGRGFAPPLIGPTVRRIVQEQLVTLRRFNEKVAKLDRSGLAQRFIEEPPRVVVTFGKGLRVTHAEPESGALGFGLEGDAHAHCPDFNETEVDAFTLSYRMLTQNNDRLSIGRLASIYESDWMPAEARANFEHAREHLNAYLDSRATLELPEGPITIRELIDVVIYGSLAHSNQGKASVFESWMATPACHGFVWAEFQAAMMKTLSFFRFFKELNEAVIQHHD